MRFLSHAIQSCPPSQRSLFLGGITCDLAPNWKFKTFAKEIHFYTLSQIFDEIHSKSTHRYIHKFHFADIWSFKD
jgi:hypothetical protein